MSFSEKLLLDDKSNLFIEMACTLPVIQQGIGALGALSSIVKLTGNVTEGVFKDYYYTCKGQISEKKAFLQSNTESRNEHLFNLAVNAIRCIPIVGSVVSYRRAEWVFMNGMVAALATAGRSC
jgi:hypothetical protein